MLQYYLFYGDEQLEAMKTGLFQLVSSDLLKVFDETGTFAP
jgi:hypothetical protein